MFFDGSASRCHCMALTCEQQTPRPSERYSHVEPHHPSVSSLVEQKMRQPQQPMAPSGVEMGGALINGDGKLSPENGATPKFEAFTMTGDKMIKLTRTKTGERITKIPRRVRKNRLPQK
ncbi:unnamed protein product [Cyprideis torosa]|uniref:Uncharacterized protein n=1 Tax=Cyprideis torosa TaxID=163714 RepID=A0A7R8ZMG6_9CRUS|nr:unnamed protein product [Cyprideis torosa]CAG0888766.1 unnamed protein product [Cyprideis torosa]